jgi:hypothetical protein
MRPLIRLQRNKRCRASAARSSAATIFPCAVAKLQLMIKKMLGMVGFY